MKSNKKKSIGANFMDTCQAKTCPATGRELRASSTLTKVRRRSVFNALERMAGPFGKNFGPDTMTFNQWYNCARQRMEKVSVRTVQNEMCHYRKALRACGRHEFADKVTNSELGLPRTSRIGKGIVIPEEVIAEAKKKAKASTVVWIDLLSLGLRIRELVRCGESLIRWKNRLMRGMMKIDVLDGTKGGRPREVFIPAERRAAALAAITAGIELIGVQGRLVVSKNLRAAVSQVSQRFARVGLEGIYSAHSFRRRFALMNYQFYLALKNSSKFALKMTCEDLGHGDQRGRWVYNSYLRATLEGNKALHHLLPR